MKRNNDANNLAAAASRFGFSVQHQSQRQNPGGPRLVSGFDIGMDGISPDPIPVPAAVIPSPVISVPPPVISVPLLQTPDGSNGEQGELGESIGPRSSP